MTITFPADFTQVKAPALSFYPIPAYHPYIPPQATEEIRESMNDWWENNGIPYIQACIEKFLREAQDGAVVEMKDANHYLLLGDTQDEVVR